MPCVKPEIEKYPEPPLEGNPVLPADTVPELPDEITYVYEVIVDPPLDEGALK